MKHAGRTCRDCALLVVTYRHDIETPGNEYYYGTCSAPRWHQLARSQPIDSPAAAQCPAFLEPGYTSPGVLAGTNPSSVF